MVSTTIFAAILLDKKYKAIKKLVLNIFLASGHINFVTDDLSDINHNYINNLSKLFQIRTLQFVCKNILKMVNNANVLAK